MSILDSVRRSVLQNSLLKESPDARAVIEAYRYHPDEEAFPCLPWLSYRMHGGWDDRVLPLTCAYYLTNLASEVLDDLMDGETTTVWATWGVSRIVLVAVELLALSQACLAQTPTDAETLRELTERFSEAIFITSNGQRKSVQRIASLDDYWEQATHKSGAFFAFGMWSGAKLAGSPAPALKSATRLGAKLGVLSQIMDDVIDFVTETQATRSNSTEFDGSLPIVLALASTRSDVSALRQALLTAPSERTSDWYLSTRKLTVALGGLAHALAIGQTYREDLLQSLNDVDPTAASALRNHIDALTAVIRNVESLKFYGVAEHEQHPD